MRQRIVVQPMGSIDVEDVLWLADRLSNAFPEARVLVASTPLQPSLEWYDWRRMQYRSEPIISYAASLRVRLGADYLLIVAGLDAYADNLNFVFGEALLGEGVAVVYTKRLDPKFYGGAEDKRLFRERLLKEALHELGHAMGLNHCNNPYCVMSFSNSVLEVDRKRPAYCPLCAEKLRRNGIVVSSRYVLE